MSSDVEVREDPPASGVYRIFRKVDGNWEATTDGMPKAAAEGIAEQIRREEAGDGS